MKWNESKLNKKSLMLVDEGMCALCECEGGGGGAVSSAACFRTSNCQTENKRIRNKKQNKKLMRHVREIKLAHSRSPIPHGT